MRAAEVALSPAAPSPIPWAAVRSRSPAHTRRLFALLILAATLASAQTVALPDPALVARMRGYVKMSWDTLARSNRDLPHALPDPKMPRKPGEPWPLYIAATESAQPRGRGAA